MYDGFLWDKNRINNFGFKNRILHFSAGIKTFFGNLTTKVIELSEFRLGLISLTTKSYFVCLYLKITFVPIL